MEKNNLMDYITWRKDLKFSQWGFQAADSLVLCCLSYIRWEPILKTPSTAKTIQTLANEFAKLPCEQQLSRVPFDVELLFAIKDSERYKDIVVSGYVSRIDGQEQKQFSALCADLDEEHSVIVFRGTDNTLIGWKEDFNMSFLSVIPSQVDAVAYVADRKPFLHKNIYVAGHSKGGNLAVYASAFCDVDLQEQIVSVYNHDGPGFQSDIINTLEYQQIKDRIHTYVPQSSVVGMLLEHVEAYTIVKSSQVSLWQHDPYSWLFEGPDFYQVEQVNTSSVLLDKTMKLWIEQLDETKREVAVDVLFEILSTTNQTTLKEISSNKIKNSAIMMKALNKVDDETKQLLFKMFTQFFNSMRIVMKERKKSEAMFK